MKQELTWPLYLAKVVPDVLGGAGVDAEQIQRTVDDLTSRARAYAAGGRLSRLALRATAAEDVVAYDPATAPLGVRAETAAVVRNSNVEHLHAHGPLGDAELYQLTYLASAALNGWFAEHNNDADRHPPTGVFAGVVDHPRGWAALGALGTAYSNGGRVAFRLPAGPVPPVPPVTGTARAGTGGVNVRCGLDGVDASLGELLAQTARGQDVIWATSTLSRYSRDPVMIAMLLDFALAHGRTVITTNAMIRPGEVFVRRHPLLAPDHRNYIQGLRDTRGLAGLHAKTVRNLQF